MSTFHCAECIVVEEIKVRKDGNKAKQRKAQETVLLYSL